MKKLLLLLILFFLFLFFTSDYASFPLSGNRIPNLSAGKYDLSLKDKKGDVEYFRIKTIYYHGNALGVIQNKDVIAGSFKKEVLRVTLESLVARYTWKNVRIGSSSEPDQDVKDWKCLSFAEGFSYEVDLFDRRYPSNINVQGIPPTLEGMRFWISIIDAHAQAELLRTESHGNISQIRKIGDKAASPDAHQTAVYDLPPFVTESSFTNGDYDTYFRGLGVIKEKTCAILEYINLGSSLRHRIQMNPELIFDQQGTSNFWGHIYVDLLSGKLLAGDLHECVIVEVKGQPFPQGMRVFERRLLQIEKIM